MAVQDWAPTPFIHTAPDELPQAAAEMALRWLGEDARGHVFLTTARNLIWANDRASRELNSGVYLKVEQGQVNAVSPLQKDDFVDLLENAGADREMLFLHGPVRDECLMVQVRRWQSRSGMDEIIMDFRRCGDVNHAVFHGLDQAFGLTRAEILVLQNMFDGLAAKDVAKRLHISIETVRTHVRAMYAKTHVHSREALFNKVRPFLDWG